ncbi:MAG: hypothetical protein ABJG78_10250 [Cyclobacteriaceae bacterium]
MNKIKSLTLTLAIVAGGLLLGRPLFIRAAVVQDTRVIQLDQTPGEFGKTELKLKAGKSYIFEVTNDGVDHEVGFVIAPTGKTEAENHIQNAYLANTVKDGDSARSKEVVLEKGEYVYFCPLNPTPQYKIVVK